MNKDGKEEIAESFIVLNLLKNIHPFQGKKDLMKLKLQPTRILNWLLIGLNADAFL